MPGDGDDLAVAHGVPETIGQRRRSIEAKDSAGRHSGLAVPTPHRSGSSRRPSPDEHAEPPHIETGQWLYRQRGMPDGDQGAG